MHSGTQSFRQPRYFGSFLVPSALSLLVGRIGSLRPLVQILALPSSAARADGANRDAAAHAATAGTSCRLLHLELEEGAGCDIVGAACAAACGCTSVGESRDGAKISASKQVAAISRSDARTSSRSGRSQSSSTSVDFPPFPKSGKPVESLDSVSALPRLGLDACTPPAWSASGSSRRSTRARYEKRNRDLHM